MSTFDNKSLNKVTHKRKTSQCSNSRNGSSNIVHQLVIKPIMITLEILHMKYI